MEQRSTPTKLFIGVAVPLVLFSLYMIFAGGSDSRSEIAPTTLNWRLRQLGTDLMGYHSLFKEFPQDLLTIGKEFERLDIDYWDIYSKGSDQPFGYKIATDGTSEACFIYTARLDQPAAIVEVISGSAEFRVTKEFESLRLNELSYESRGIAIWSEASAGEKFGYYLFLPHRLFEWHFTVNRN